MLVLKFDAESFFNDYCQELVKAATECMEHFYNDAKTGMRKAKDFELKETLLQAGKMIEARCMFYAHSILDSYGTGSAMDMENEALEEYRKSPLWNRNRMGTTIAGRKKGGYTNILGEEVESTGAFVHLQDISKIMKERYGIDINQTPSCAIQNAEKKLDAGLNGGYVDRIIYRYTENFLANASKYFYNETV